jgi:hypothetical protein
MKPRRLKRLKRLGKPKPLPRRRPRRFGQPMRPWNPGMKPGVLGIEANKKRAVKEAARLNILSLAKHRQELAKLCGPPGDPLMQAPKGPAPSQQEIRHIQKEVAVQPRKWKLRDAKVSVSVPKPGNQCYDTQPMSPSLIIYSPYNFWNW